MKKKLRLAGAAEDAIDLLLNEVDIEGTTIDQEGNIADWDNKLNNLKTKRKSLFAEVVHQTGTPGSQQSSETKDIGEMSSEEYYQSIDMKPFSQTIRS